MTILGIILLALGAWTNFDNQADPQMSQTINGLLVMLLGGVLITLGETTWLDSIFFARGRCP